MSDVVDLLEDSPPRAEHVPPTDDQLRQAIKGLLMGKDLSTVSLKALRLDLEKSFHLSVGGLDSRKGEIRQLAQDLVLEAQNAPAPPAAPTTPVEPAAKKRRTLAQAIPTAGPGGLPAAAPASPVKTKGPKRKAAPSAYSLWSLEHRSTVAEELEQELQRKPTFGEISKAVPERWKAVSEADKASYEEKAKLAKAEAMHDVPKEKPKKATAAEGSKKGKGKGKGKGKDGEEPMMSRAEFFAASPVINCAFQIPGVQAAESSMENLVARMFKSQGVGWFSSTKFQVPVASKEVTVQAQVVMNVAGSKHWEDGEGLDEVMTMLEQRQAGGCKPEEGVDSVAPEKSEVYQALEHPETESAQQEAPAAAAGNSSEADAAAKDADEAPPNVEAADSTEVGSKLEDVKTQDDAKEVEPSEVEQPNNEAANGEEDSKMEDAAQAEASEAQPVDAPKEASHPAESPMEEASDPSAEVESKVADLEEKALVGGA